MKDKYMWLSQMWLMTGVISEKYVLGIMMTFLMAFLSFQDRK